MQGRAFGSEQVSIGEAEIVVRQAVTPQVFSCVACGLKLQGQSELTIARVGDQDPRTTKYSPAEYYKLIDPRDDAAVQSIVEQYLADADYGEYDNE